MNEEATAAVRQVEEEIQKLLKLQKQMILMNSMNIQNKEVAVTLDEPEEDNEKS